jgi:hypothetical protein
MAEVLTVLNSLPLASAPVDTSEQYSAACQLVIQMAATSRYAADKRAQRQFAQAAVETQYEWHPPRTLQLQLQERFEEQIEGHMPLVLTFRTDAELQKMMPDLEQQTAAALIEGQGLNAVLLQQLVAAALRNEAQLQLLKCRTSIELDQALLQLLQDEAAGCCPSSSCRSVFRCTRCSDSTYSSVSSRWASASSSSKAEAAEKHAMPPSWEHDRSSSHRWQQQQCKAQGPTDRGVGCQGASEQYTARRRSCQHQLCICPTTAAAAAAAAAGG